MNQRPLIFISNDDGARAKGINQLIEMLRPVADLVVVAPTGGRSGAACSITSREPVTYHLVKRTEGVAVYVCSGTPVDCVKLGLERMVPRRPDLIVGGINHGDNASVNVHYSGTMGIVFEGSMKGIPAIGFSSCCCAEDADFTPLTPYVQKIVQHVIAEGLPPFTCLNVNFPDAPAFHGVKICRMARGQWSAEWVRGVHPRGEEYFWLTGTYINEEPTEEDTDSWALAHGYVAITPTQVDVTAYGLMDTLKKWDL